MMKIATILAILACLAVSATAQTACSYKECTTPYPNCKPFCVPNTGCPTNYCGAYSDGCGGSYPCTCPSTDYFCGNSNNCCPNKCTTTVQANNGVSYTLDGVCAYNQPENTVDGGPCQSGCGTCWVSSFNPNLCKAGVNGSPCAGGTCACYNTDSGASCSASNLVGPINPAPSNGGGCEENACNALAAKVGKSAACCPSGCKKSGRKAV